MGEVEIQVPRDRNGEFRSQLIEKYALREVSLDRDIALLFLSGFSTRSVAMVSKALLGTAISLRRSGQAVWLYPRVNDRLVDQS